MRDLDILQKAWIWLGGGIVLFISVVSAVRVLFYKNASASSVAYPYRILVLLSIELLAFMGVGIIIGIVSPSDLADYVTFAVPCIAGIVVGIGVVFKYIQNNGVGVSLLIDYYSYVFSIALLFGSLVIYISSKDSMEVISYSSVLFSALCFLGYMYLISVAPSENFKVSKVLLGGVLFLFVVLFGYVTWENRDVLASYKSPSADPKNANNNSQNCCCDLKKTKHQ